MNGERALRRVLQRNGVSARVDGEAIRVLLCPYGAAEKNAPAQLFCLTADPRLPGTGDRVEAPGGPWRAVRAGSSPLGSGAFRWALLEREGGGALTAGEKEEDEDGYFAR